MNKDRPVPPEDVPSGTFNHAGGVIFPISQATANQASIQGGVHLAVVEDHDAVVKAIPRLMGFPGLQDQLVHPRLVPSFDELVEGGIQWGLAAISGALENFAVDAEHGIRTLASDAMQERLLDV